MSDHIEHTTFDDLAGREVTWADPGAPHQLDLRMDSDPTDCIVGCTCGAQRVRQRMDAPIAEMWLAYNTLDHLPQAHEVVHQCPADGEGVMPCCDRTPFEVDPVSRMTLDPALVTCGRKT